MRNLTEHSDCDVLERVIRDACSSPAIQLKCYSEILSDKRRRLYEAFLLKRKAGEIQNDEDEDASDDGDINRDEDDTLNLRKSTISKEDITELEDYQKTVQVDQCEDCK